ncbi:hypothetical protein AMTR_s00061p00128770 [Amborella trichopoda]|uniref:Pentatricopeptide repeat-containing protein n=1 Tax=Amborella trichopoda TaxID=13333 RepID=U5DFB3_AMBTC|nr:hypothetical protein AMTR_s00061p00128770 [Amborella trichopoda]
MHRSGLKPNQFTFASVFKACGALSSSELGKQVHGFSVKSGCDFNVYVSSSIVDMYTRNGEMGGAHKVFDEMTERNEVCWNALIAGYARKGEGENSLEQFLKMQRAGKRNGRRDGETKERLSLHKSSERRKRGEVRAANGGQTVLSYQHPLGFTLVSL